MIAAEPGSGRADARAPSIWQASEGGRPVALLVVDRLVGGRACGGLRIAPAVSAPELRALAATMTLKFAFAGIACGGAKAGVSVPAGATGAERRRRTRVLAKAIAPLLVERRYIPGTDLGSDARDVWELHDAAGMRSGPRPAGADTAPGTAAWSGQSAAIAAEAALAARGRRLAGATAAVAGYGRVGRAFARRFVASGGRLVAVSTVRAAVVDPEGLDAARLEALAERYGDEAPLRYADARRIAPDDLFACAVDVLAPCGGWRALDVALARRARCLVVSPGANAALTADAEAVLEGNGVTVLPDFVASAGGILVGHFWPIRLPAVAVRQLLEGHFRRLVDRILAAAGPALPATAVARRLAEGSLLRLEGPGLAAALRHERWIDTLGTSRLAARLPDTVMACIVRRLSRQLAPPPIGRG